MAVREARLDDANAIASIHGSSWRAAHARRMSEDTALAVAVPARETPWRRVLAEARGTLFVSEAGGGVRGFCHVAPARDADARAPSGS